MSIDFKDTSIFQGVIQFSVDGEEFRFIQKGEKSNMRYKYEVLMRNGHNFVHQSYIFSESMKPRELFRKYENILDGRINEN